MQAGTVADVNTVTAEIDLPSIGVQTASNDTRSERPSSYIMENGASVSGYNAPIRDTASRCISFDNACSVSNPNLDNTILPMSVDVLGLMKLEHRGALDGKRPIDHMARIAPRLLWPSARFPS